MNKPAKKIYNNVVFFEERFILRLKDEDKNKISKIVNKNSDIFESDSHFVRCAIIRFLRDFDKNGRRK